ncbi:MAG: glycosyltransferase, partial [Gelidibacter sp.]
MPFAFLTYLQPTHYFRLFTKAGISVFPKVEALPELVLEQLQVDLEYTSDLARDYDVSWQAVQAGYIGEAATYTHFESVPIRDNYHFIRKQFHPAWVFYVLFVRLVTFHNPIREIRGWLETSHIRRRAESVKPISNANWESYQSALITKEPLVSVVIPTLNRYGYLKDVLKDFENQDYSHFE